MRKLVLLSLVVVVVAAGMGAASAEARVRWPAECKTFRCVNKHMNNLHARLKGQARLNRVQNRRLNNHQAILNCEAIIPLTQYGDPEGTFGYQFNDGVNPIFSTSALDVTADGDTVGAWFVIDTCETSTTPRALPRGLNLRPHTTGLQR